MSRILIVDDDLRVADAIASQLGALSHQCIIESKGARVLEKLGEAPFDLLLLDVMLPGMSGFELCRTIRRDSRFFTLPILMVSAMNGEEEIVHGLAQGADDYVGKPFEMAKLMRRIEALLHSTTTHPAVDTLTGLPSAEGMKREVHKRIIEGEAFALCYAEIVQIREFGFKCSQEDRNRAIRHFARALEQMGKALKSEVFLVGHMGGGHFVSTLPTSTAQVYCEKTREMWLTHLEAFYESIGQKRAFDFVKQKGASNDSIPLLDVLFCLMYNDGKEVSSPKRLFEVLSQVRYRAQSTKSGGLFVDRRAHAAT